jgi:hypothetical protein
LLSVPPPPSSFAVLLCLPLPLGKSSSYLPFLLPLPTSSSS